MSDVEVRGDIEVVVTEEAAAAMSNSGLPEDVALTLTSYLKSELDDVIDGSERATFMSRVATWRRMSIVEPEQATQSWPWPGASNTVTPIAAQKVNTIFAKLVAMYAQVRPTWSVTSPRKDTEGATLALASYLNAISVSPMQLDLARKNRVIMYDLVRLGTQVVKVPWRYEEVPIKKGNAEGGASNAVRVTHNGPDVMPIRLEDFVCRTAYADIEKMPWVGHLVYLTKAELDNRALKGIYVDVDKVVGSPQTSLEASREVEQQRSGLAAMVDAAEEMNRVYEIAELYVRVDGDGDGIAEDYKVWFHRATGTILRSELNLLGRRDYVLLRYFTVPNELYGVGVCQLLERLQGSADFMFNTRVNDLELILTPAFKRRQGSMAMKKKKVSPGSFIDMSDLNDVQPLVVPNFTASTYAAENLVRDYADRLSGANDPMSGYGDSTLKSGSNAASLMFLAQQGNSILNAVFDGIQRDYDEIGQLVVLQTIIAFNDAAQGVDLDAINDEERSILEALFRESDVASLPSQFRFTVRSTDISRSDDTKQQNIMVASQIYQAYGQSAVPMTQMLMSGQLDEATSQMMMTLLRGATVLAKQSLELLHIADVDSMFIPMQEGGQQQ
jgi:hypothetical protein